MKKLKEAGYYTLEALFMRPKKARRRSWPRPFTRFYKLSPSLRAQDLIAVKGLSEAKVDKILDSAAKVRASSRGGVPGAQTRGRVQTH